MISGANVERRRRREARTIWNEGDGVFKRYRLHGPTSGSLGDLGGEFLGLGYRLLDGADHVEGLLWQMVVLAVAEPLEALDGVGEVDELAGRAGEHFGDVERLRQEALDLAGARHGDLVLFRELVHAENGDDVLEPLVALQYLLHAPRHGVVLFAHDQRREHARSGIERVDGGIDALLGNTARQHRGGVEMGEG